MTLAFTVHGMRTMKKPPSTIYALSWIFCAVVTCLFYNHVAPFGYCQSAEPVRKAQVKVTQWVIDRDRVSFELRNVGAIAAMKIKVEASADAAGQTVKANASELDIILGPGEKVTHWAVFRDAADRSVAVPSDAQLKWRVEWLDTDRPRPSLDVEVTDVRYQFPLDQGIVEARARITNQSEGPVRSPIRTFWALYEKRSGRLLSASKDLVVFQSPLAPGKSVTDGYIASLPPPYEEVPRDKQAAVAANLEVRVFAFAEYQPGGLGVQVLHPALRRFSHKARFSIIGRDKLGSTVLAIGYGRYQLSEPDKDGVRYLESILGKRLVIPPNIYSITATVTWEDPLFGAQSEKQTRQVKVAPGKITTVRFFEDRDLSPIPRTPWISVRLLPSRPTVPATVVGQSMEVQIRVKNEGPAPAHIVLEHGPFQPGPRRPSNLVEVLGVRPSQGSVTSPTECDLGTLKPGQHATVTVALKGKAASTVVYRAHVRSPSEPIVGESDSLRIRIAKNFVAGQVAALDGSGKIRPLEHVMVLIAPPSRATAPFFAFTVSQDEHRTFTDSKGYFVFPDVTLDAYVLGVVLRDRHGGVGVALNGLEVEGAANVLTVKHDRRGLKVHKILFDNGSEGFLDHVTSTEKGISKEDARFYLPRFREAALLYTDLHECAHFASQFLAAPVFPKQAPPESSTDTSVQAVIFANSTAIKPDTGVLHFKGSTAANPWQGTVQTHEYHEMGHAVHWLSQLSGVRRLPPRLSGDKNHGGVLNKDSTDSFVEGVAHFFAALVRGKSELILSTQGRKIDLDQNIFWTKVWLENEQKMVRAPDEELNVAALLWDLYDDDAEPGDYFALGYDGIAAILNHDSPVSDRQGPIWRKVRNVHTFYLFLVNRGYRNQDSNGNRIPDLDELFALHGFYDDSTQPFGKWTPLEEPIGFGHRWNNQRRESPPPLRGAGLRYRFAQPIDVPVTFRVSVRFPASASDKDYDFMAPGRGQGGVLRVFAPPDSSRLAIVPLLPGFTAKPLELDTAEYWRRVERAHRNGSDVFVEHEFALERSSVPTPEQFATELQPDGTVRLSWQVPEGVDRVLLVRRADRFAECLTDGEVIYVGSREQYSDVDVYQGETYYYALFAASGGSLSRPARARVTIPALSEGDAFRGAQQGAGRASGRDSVASSSVTGLPDRSGDPSASSPSDDAASSGGQGSGSRTQPGSPAGKEAASGKQANVPASGRQVPARRRAAVGEQQESSRDREATSASGTTDPPTETAVSDGQGTPLRDRGTALGKAATISGGGPTLSGAQSAVPGKQGTTGTNGEADGGRQRAVTTGKGAPSTPSASRTRSAPGEADGSRAAHGASGEATDAGARAAPARWLVYAATAAILLAAVLWVVLTLRRSGPTAGG